MKKVMLGAAVCAMAFSANAKDVVVGETVTCTSAFNSIYAGLGIGGSFLNSDDMDFVKGGGTLVKDGSGFKDYVGDTEKVGIKANRFAGSFVIGGGKVFSNRVYLGGEFLMDISKNKKISREVPVNVQSVNGFVADDMVRVDDGIIVSRDSVIYSGSNNIRINGKSYTNEEFRALQNNSGSTSDSSSLGAASSGSVRDDVKIGGFIPQLNLKVGYVFKNDTLVYGKLGCVWTKFSVDHYAKESGSDWVKIDGGSKTKASFVLGLGAEKAFCKKFSAAVEGDYNFGWKQAGYKANKGWSVRALVKYNVKY